MIAALLQHDLEASRRWLVFPRSPPLEVRQSLLRAGWQYHRGCRGWHHNNPTAPIPPGFAVGQGGSCSYPLTTPPRDVVQILARTRARIATHAGVAPA